MVKIEFNKFGNKIAAQATKFWDKTKQIGSAFKREAHETKIAVQILKKLARKEEVTAEQIEFLKNQSVDLGKAIAIVGLQAIPGSSVAVIALEKLGEKHGFTVFPKDQIDPNMNPSEPETFD